MIELQGKYNRAKVFTDNIESEAISQIIELCNQEFVEGSQIAIMPDVHAGKGCTIGTTMTIKDKVVPNLVGLDIGCGMLCIMIKEKDIDFKKLDDIIRGYVPNGFNTRKDEHKFISKVRLHDLKCKPYLSLDRAALSLGTLGGGNHFIEMNKDSQGNIYLVIHTGSRYLGKQIAEYYQEVAYNNLVNMKDLKTEIIKKLKSEGREKEIGLELAKVKIPKINKNLTYLEGADLENYLHDIEIAQEYSTQNRLAIADEIIKNMGFTVAYQFTTIHNYIDTKNMILRKGAISAQKGEKVIIPINMRDGSIIAIGKGNPDWNFSGPHGAGRLMSRSKSKEKITLEEFKTSMEDIWSSSVCESTIDEAPMAYKPMDEIVENIKGTADIIEVIKPIYNFKAN